MAYNTIETHDSVLECCIFFLSVCFFKVFDLWVQPVSCNFEHSRTQRCSVFKVAIGLLSVTSASPQSVLQVSS